MIDCTLDSVAFIDLLREKAGILDLLAGYTGIGLSHVALGEVLVGAFKRLDPGEFSRISDILSSMSILVGDDTTSVVYARIRSDLERQGTMIPQNDIWIAAASLQANVPLITRDAHFQRIEGLIVATY